MPLPLRGTPWTRVVLSLCQQHVSPCLLGARVLEGAEHTGGCVFGGVAATCGVACVLAEAAAEGAIVRQTEEPVCPGLFVELESVVAGQRGDGDAGGEVVDEGVLTEPGAADDAGGEGHGFEFGDAEGLDEGGVAEDVRGGHLVEHGGSGELAEELHRRMSEAIPAAFEARAVADDTQPEIGKSLVSVDC